MSFGHICKYCGDLGKTGGSCYYSPDGIHEDVPDDPDTCVRCGSTSYGTGCYYPHPDNGPGQSFHKHGVGERRCVWCGHVMGREGNLGDACIFSPTGRHSLS